MKNTQFEELFHLFYSPLCNYVRKVMGNDFLAEDLVQNLFIELWEKNEFDTIMNVEKYLLRSVKYKCIDHFRKQKNNRSVELNKISFDLSESASEITEKDIEPLLHYYAAKLPPKTRQVFLLSRESKLTYKQISEKLGVSIKTIENQMGNALKQLRILLKENGFYLVAIYFFRN